MKTAFKILPELSGEREYHLLVEAGRDGVSLVWYSQNPLKIEGLFIYQAQKDLAEVSTAENIQQLLATEDLPAFHSSFICYNFKESLIVPDEYFKEQQQAELLNCVYGSMQGSRIFNEPVAGLDAVNIYRIPERVHAALSNRFASARTKHSNSLLVPFLKNKNLYCIVYNSSVKILLYTNGNLQLVQMYEYSTPSDVAYHLLNTCTQHGCAPSEITLTLSGFIDTQSNLYEELYRYFLTIDMDELPQGIDVPDEVRNYPDHFFSFLISLVKCAS